MTEMVQPLRKLIDIKKYKCPKKLIWIPESIEAFHFCRIAVSNCQELYFLEDTATPILQTDASDYGIGGYMCMVTNGQVRVIRFFSKSLIGSQLNWSARQKECYGVNLFEDLLDNRYFILKTDHKNLTFIMCYSLVRSYDGNSTCRIRTLIYSMFPARKSINLYLMHYTDYVQIMSLHLLFWLSDA